MVVRVRLQKRATGGKLTGKNKLLIILLVAILTWTFSFWKWIHDQPQDKAQSINSFNDIHPTVSHSTNLTQSKWGSKATLPTVKSNIVEFEPQPGVVIVTKLHGPHQIRLLEQSLCLLTQAYNRRMKYPIVVFTTEFLNDTLLEPIRKVVAPASLTVVQDSGTLQQAVAQLSPIRRENFLSRCQVTNASSLTWFSECNDGRLAYNWQAEFRSWHLWRHPALVQYQTMMWLDTDAFCTKDWDRDPIAIFRQQDLVIMFDNFPMGSAGGQDKQGRIQTAFGKKLCSLELNQEGHFVSTTATDSCPTDSNGRARSSIGLIHGFLHITNLDFYRQYVDTWSKTLIGDCFCCRRFDDQLAVTVPPALLAPERAWDMYRHDIRLGVFHNFFLDGKRPKLKSFKRLWEDVDQKPYASGGVCTIHHGA